MITLALDENGKFEEALSTKEEKPIMIAGIIYDDNGDWHDAEYERYRISSYLRAVCDSLGAKYPQDLHTNSTGNKVTVGKVKRKVGETLREFLREGTYEKKELPTKNGKVIKRAGKYVMFAELRSSKGVKKRACGWNDNDLTQDEKVSNLYLHMAENAVNRTLFHNPIYEDVTDVSLYFPTRKVVLSGRDREYDKQDFKIFGGKEKVEAESGKMVHYDIVSSDFYRTIMENECTRINKKELNVHYMNTSPISYWENNENYNTFLYLADIVCSMLDYHKKGSGPAEWLDSFSEWGSKYFGENQVILFGYDDIDEAYMKAVDAVRQGDYFHALDIIYDAERSGSEFTEHYSSYWFKKLIKKIRKTATAENLCRSISDLEGFTRRSNLDQQKLLWLFEEIKTIADEGDFENKYHTDQVMFDMCSAGVAVYNHIGDFHTAKVYYDECMKHTGDVDLVKILSASNKMVVFLDDAFMFSDATEQARKNAEYQKALHDIKSKICLENADEDLNYAKSLSQYGQALACEKNPEAESAFREALRHMKKGSANYQITLSYLLHFYLDMGMTDAYRENSIEYFGRSKLKDQLKELLKLSEKSDSTVTFKFAMYIFVRSLWVLNEPLSDSIRGKLEDIEETLQKNKKDIVGHPWELIFKYLALIFYRDGNREAAEKYINKSEECLESQGLTIDAIIHNGKYEYAELSGDEEMMEREKAYFEERDIDRKNVCTFMYH